MVLGALPPQLIGWRPPVELGLVGVGVAPLGGAPPPQARAEQGHRRGSLVLGARWLRPLTGVIL